MAIEFIGRFGTGDERLDVDLRDLEIRQGGSNGPQLLAVSGVNGGVASFDLGPIGQGGQTGSGRAMPQLEHSLYHSNMGLRAGAADLLEIGGETRLVLAGGLQDGLSYHLVGAQGRLAAQEQIPVGAADMAGLVAAATVSSAGPQGALYALDLKGDLYGWRLQASGERGAAVAVSGHSDLPGAMALVQADLPGGGQALVLADRVAQGLVSYRVDPTSGALSRADSLGAAEGLGVSEPTVLESFTAHGTSWVLMGAAGSGTLSLVELGRQGQLILWDHVIDTAQTRFGAITALEVIEHEGAALVLAAGGDDGLALLRLLPDGQLVHIESLAHDTGLAPNTGLGLASVTALAATVEGDALQIFASSASAPGVSQFSVSLADLGVIAGVGGNGAVAQGLIQGTAGADVLVGSHGAVLMGGAGADVFVLRPDAAEKQGRIEIRDFTPGEDQLDLAAFEGLRSMEDLGHQLRPDGAVLSLAHLPQDGPVLRTEVVLRSDTGSPLALEDLFAEGFQFADRMLPPAQAPDPQRVGSAGADLIVARPAGDQIRAFGGADTVLGDMGHDSLFGGGGRDHLEGGARADRLYGQAGRDTLLGEAGRDHLQGGAGADRLLGGAGRDQLSGGAGGDRLFGGGGADQLRGGGQNDRLQGGAQADKLWGQGGQDRLWGGAGKDQLIGGAGRDVLTGGAGADVFVFAPAHGSDRIRDFTPGLDQIRLQGEAGAQRFQDLQLNQQGADVLVNTGRGQIRLEDLQLAELGAEDFLF